MPSFGTCYTCRPRPPSESASGWGLEPAFQLVLKGILKDPQFPFPLLKREPILYGHQKKSRWPLEGTADEAQGHQDPTSSPELRQRTRRAGACCPLGFSRGPSRPCCSVAPGTCGIVYLLVGGWLIVHLCTRMEPRESRGLGYFVHAVLVLRAQNTAWQTGGAQ